MTSRQQKNRIRKGTPRSTKLSSPLKSCCIKDVSGTLAMKKRYMALVAASTMEMGMLSVSKPIKRNAIKRFQA